MTITTSDIINWSSRASYRGSYTASLSVVNKDSNYGETNLAEVINITTTTTSTVANVTSGDITILNGSKLYVNGLLEGIDEKTGISERMIGFAVKSFFARLTKKPVNTEVNIGEATAAATTILDEYAGVPSGIYSVSLAARTVCGPITGSNILDELKRVAQAGLGALYVDEVGILQLQEWTDLTAAAAYTIPDEFIISAQRAMNEEIIPSRVKVRGCWVSQMPTSPVELQDSGGGSGQGGQGDSQGSRVRCLNKGLPAKEGEFIVEVPRQHGEEHEQKVLKNAEVVVAGATFSHWEGMWSTGAKFVAEKTTGFFSAASEIDISVLGQPQPKKEKKVKPKEDQKNKKGDHALQEMARRLNGRPPNGNMAGGGGSPGGESQRSPTRSATERTDLQIEMTIDDSDLQSKHGPLSEQIDNPYIEHPATLFQVGVRHLQERKMAQKSWKVETVILPGVSINDLVTFRDPKLTDGTQTVITGLVVGIDTQWQDGEGKQNLVIESTEDLGSTTYTSQNLILHPSLHGPTNQWVVTEGTYKINLAGTVMSFKAVPPVSGTDTGTVDLTQEHTIVGEDYTFSFTHSETTGVGVQTLDFRIYDSGGDISTTVISTDGTTSVNFTARQTTTNFEWLVDITSLQDKTIWRVTRPVLTMTMTV